MINVKQAVINLPAHPATATQSGNLGKPGDLPNHTETDISEEDLDSALIACLRIFARRGRELRVENVKLPGNQVTNEDFPETTEPESKDDADRRGENEVRKNHARSHLMIGGNSD